MLNADRFSTGMRFPVIVTICKNDFWTQLKNGTVQEPFQAKAGVVNHHHVYGSGS
jgi:hypothetical protein